MRPPALPRAPGVGFKPRHADALVAEPGPVRFVEIHAENYMGHGGPPHARLAAMRARHALSVHGVGLSLGGEERLDRDHLDRLATLCRRYEPEAVSEHLAWSSHGGHHFADLLPIAYTEASLARVAERVDAVQERLGRRLLVENPAVYLSWRTSTIPETEFLDRLAARTGCGLLLDVSNVVVSCANLRTDPEAYLDAFPLHRVEQVHLAGHARERDVDGGDLLIDSHGGPVPAEAWALFERVVARVGPLPTLVEWDNDVPDWPALVAEAEAVATRLAAAAA